MRLVQNEVEGMLRLGSDYPCGLVLCTRYGVVDEVLEALGPCWH